MLIAIIFSVLGFILAGMITYLFIPFIIKSSEKVGLITVDAHKPDKPNIAEPGGLVILISFIFSFSFVILIIVALEQIISPLILGFELNITTNNIFLAEVLAGLLAITIAGLIGFIDDVFGIVLKWRHKILLGFLPAIPLMIIGVGEPTLDLPFLGPTSLPILYPFLIIPLATNFTFNSFNMVAGFNGLETGLGIISFSSIFLTILLFTTSINPLVLILSGTMLGTLLVFYSSNKFPAKILIGDVGTLTIGTALFVTLILGNIERLALGIFLLYFINFGLFFIYKFTGQTQKLAEIEVKIDKKVVLKPSNPYTVYWILPYYRETTEKGNVYFLFLVQGIFCVLAIVFFVISTG